MGHKLPNDMKLTNRRFINFRIKKYHICQLSVIDCFENLIFLAEKDASKYLSSKKSSNSVNNRDTSPPYKFMLAFMNCSDVN